jgi:hypothetical protein
MFFTGEYGDMGSESVIMRTPMLELTSHSDVLIAADWMAGGSQVITASWDRAANLHDAESGDVISVLAGELRERIFSQALNLHGHRTYKYQQCRSDQYARVPKHGRMLPLFDPIIGLVEL